MPDHAWAGEGGAISSRRSRDGRWEDPVATGPGSLRTGDGLPSGHSSGSEVTLLLFLRPGHRTRRSCASR